MLKQAVIREIHQGKITKEQGHLVVATRFYPRFLPRASVHEYISDLAPSRTLLKEFKEAAVKVGHNRAFIEVHYEQRFTLSAAGYWELSRLAKESARHDVYLACYCDRHLFCHRELLLLLAKNLFDIEIENTTYKYPLFNFARCLDHLAPKSFFCPP